MLIMADDIDDDDDDDERLNDVDRNDANDGDKMNVRNRICPSVHFGFKNEHGDDDDDYGGRNMGPFRVLEIEESLVRAEHRKA